MTTDTVTDRSASVSGEGADPSQPPGGFFTHHGVWAPGVRLFRSIGFMGKATIVSGIFVVIVAQSMALFVASALSALSEARLERVGIAAQRELLHALPAAIEIRAAAARPDKAGATTLAQSLAQLEQRLVAAQAAGGSSLDIGATLKFVRQAVDPVKQPPADRDEAFAQADGLVQQLLRAVVAVGDQSGLSTDPDPVVYGLMLAVTQETLQLAASIGRVSDLGAAAQTSGEASPATRRVVQGETYSLFKQVERLFDRYETVTKEDPALQAAIGHDKAFDPVNAFMRGTRRALPAEGAAAGDGSALLAAGNAATKQMVDLAQRGLGVLDERVAARISVQQNKLMLQLGFVALCLTFAGYLFHSFYLVTRGGMAELKRHITAMAAGDLKTQPRPWGRDETADVLRSVDQMQVSLRTLIGAVRECASEIVNASGQVSEGAQDMSQRVETSAARLQQSASSMESIAGLSRDSATEIGRSAELGKTASVNAASSQTEIVELVARIERLHASSQKVGDIVGVIDSIAFQTNILALNAAVEAARAGEQGRGFAVVASEVRALAQRSATAAREIKTLVAASTEQTASGTQAVHAAGASIKRLAAEVQTIGGTLERVSAANVNQAHEVAAVAKSISDLDHDAQKNAALVEQTSAAALSMREKADQLAQATARFSL